MCKFGYSNNLINRFKQHEYDFGEISIQLILEAPDIQEIEKRLKNEISSHGINTVYEIDGRKLKELFLPEHFDKVCENHEYRMACEQTKQKHYDVEMTLEQTKQKQYEAEITSEQTK